MADNRLSNFRMTASVCVMNECIVDDSVFNCADMSSSVTVCGEAVGRRVPEGPSLRLEGEDDS